MSFNELNSVEHFIIHRLTGVNLNNLPAGKAGKMLSELLPFYVSAEAFINHAVSTSAGSLSPRTKWKDLSVLEISIPDLKTQEKIFEVFQQIETTLSQLKQQRITLKNLKQKLLNEILG